MQKNISLSIPKSCNENWGKFTQTSHGGYCTSCSKTVVDFSKMDDDAIYNFFKNKPTHACGRFRRDQLKAYSLTTSEIINPRLSILKAGFLSLLFIVIGKPTSARPTEPSKTEVVGLANYRTQSSVNEASEHIVKGVVRSIEDGEPLAGINIILKGSSIGTTTDSYGQFEFPQKLQEGDVLIFSFIGLGTVEYVVPDQLVETAIIEMSIHMVLDMGEVAVTEIYTPPSGFQRLWTKVKNLF